MTGSRTATAKTTSAAYRVRIKAPRLASTCTPPCPTVKAMAAPTPIGANFMTIPVNLNITSATPAQNPTMTSFGLPLTCVSASPNRMDQNTTCSTSFCAAASKKLCGTMCWSTLARVVLDWATGPAAAAVPSATPTPGCTTFTITSPTTRASVVTTSK